MHVYAYSCLYTVVSMTILSSSSNSTIVPLFEKVLSASDAGRIGRLVLPKACAEVSYKPVMLVFRFSLLH